MPTYVQIVFGGYSYLGIVQTGSESLAYRARTSKSVGRDGQFTQGSLLDTRTVTLKGIVGGGSISMADFRTALDSFKGAHLPGVPRQLFLDSDRYLHAEVASLSEGDWEGLNWQDVDVSLLCADPYFYAVAASTALIDDLIQSVFGSVVTDEYYTNPVGAIGTAYSLPKVRFYVKTAGIAVTISNNAGDSMTLLPNAAGYYEADSQAETISYNALVASDTTSLGTDAAAIWTGGQFISLAAGGDVVTVHPAVPSTLLSDLQTSGGVTGRIVVLWQDRWI